MINDLYDRFMDGFMDGTEWLHDRRGERTLLSSPYFWLLAGIAVIATLLTATPWPAIVVLALPLLEIMVIPLCLGISFGVAQLFNRSAPEAKPRDRNWFKHRLELTPIESMIERYEARAEFTKVPIHTEEQIRRHTHAAMLMNHHQNRWR